MSDEENLATSDSANKPFFAIEAEDLGDSTASSPPSTALPPAPVMMGTLSGAATSSEPHAQESMNPWGSVTPQMTGNVANINGMFPLQAPAEAVKSAFRWGQFFLGLFLPWMVFIGTVVIAEALDETQDPYPDFSRSVWVSMEPDENGWYVQSVDRTQGESMEFFFNSEYINDTDWSNVYCWYHPYDVEWQNNGKVIQESPGTRDYLEEEVIGEYTESNQTVWFKTNESTAPTTHDVEIFYYDEVASDAYWEEQNANFDALDSFLFCGGPLLFIVGTIAAFVKGNKGLGIGLLCSIPMSILMGPFMFVLLLLMYGF